MSGVDSCTVCGHELGVGRFCTNCGAPVAAPDWRTDTAERKLGAPPAPLAPAPVAPVAPADPRTPPAAVAPPPPPRYPLFADELDSWTPSGQVVTDGSQPAPPVDATEPPVPEEYVDQAPYLGSYDDQHDYAGDDGDR